MPKKWSWSVLVSIIFGAFSSVAMVSGMVLKPTIWVIRLRPWNPVRAFRALAMKGLVLISLSSLAFTNSVWVEPESQERHSPMMPRGHFLMNLKMWRFWQIPSRVQSMQCKSYAIRMVALALNIYRIC